MKAPRQTKEPIESFGPELMAALVKGGKEEFKIPFPTRSRARYFQSRIHTLRTRMRDLNHAHYPISMKCKVSIIEQDGKVYVRLAPRDSEFSDELKAAGVTVEELGEATVPVAPEPTAAVPEEDFNAFLQRMGSK